MIRPGLLWGSRISTVRSPAMPDLPEIGILDSVCTPAHTYIRVIGARTYTYVRRCGCGRYRAEMICARTGCSGREIEEGPSRVKLALTLALATSFGREMTGAYRDTTAVGRYCSEGDRFEYQGDRLIARGQTHNFRTYEIDAFSSAAACWAGRLESEREYATRGQCRSCEAIL